MLRRLLNAVRTFAVEIVLRRILIPVVLFLSYFVGVGTTALVARLFFRSKLGRNSRGAGSNWIKAEGYEPVESSALEQS